MRDPNSIANMDAAKRYLRAIELRARSAVSGLFDPDMTLEQFPNRIYPKGLRIGLAEMFEAAERGKKLLESERYQITHEVADGDTIALEVLWTGVLAMPLGTLPTGSEMRAHFAVFLEFKDGKIVSQRNYDCFDPW